jgi:beta-galactosidase
MVYIRREQRIVEYIPFNVGFGTTEFRDGQIIRNGRPVAIRSARYNALADRAAASRDLSALMRQGVNTILVDYPQPYWFYGLTDSLGLYVVDQANINTDIARGDRSIEGSIVNDPRFTDFFVRRAEAMYERSRNHPSIIAFSIGGPSGNGYNMYKAYQALKAKEETRPVVYIDADGEFNSDLPWEVLR